MKDEEMAEEWVRTNRNILKDCLSACVRTEYKNDIQAFLAGLKAGRPQWHDLREDPNDLPKEEKEYLVYTKEWGVEIRGYFADDKYFSCRRNMVIAWCEIPTFDKE